MTGVLIRKEETDTQTCEGKMSLWCNHTEAGRQSQGCRDRGAASRSPGAPTGQANCQTLGRGQEGDSPTDFRGVVALLAPWFWSSTLENCETINSWGFGSHSICGMLLDQPKETKTDTIVYPLQFVQCLKCANLHWAEMNCTSFRDVKSRPSVYSWRNLTLCFSSFSPTP